MAPSGWRLGADDVSMGVVFARSETYLSEQW